MNYCLYKLNFKTAVHFGSSQGGAHLASTEETICADTLYSALMIEALKLGGESLLNELYVSAKEGKLLFSDLFPFRDEELYLPKPSISIASISSDSSSNGDVKNRKLFRKLNFIPASKFEKYISYIKGDADFDVAMALDKADFGVKQLRVRASLNREDDEATPYYVGTYIFHQDCGLYFIVAYEDESLIEILERILVSLSYTGIGGKVSSGLGKFELDDCIYLEDPYSDCLEALYKLLNLNDASYYMSLTTSLPSEEELGSVLEDSFYTVVRRGGFVQSDNYADTQLKKKDIYAFSSGSCFRMKFLGDIYDISFEGAHSVFRYLKPLFLGVSV